MIHRREEDKTSPRTRTRKRKGRIRTDNKPFLQWLIWIIILLFLIIFQLHDAFFIIPFFFDDHEVDDIASSNANTIDVNRNGNNGMVDSIEATKRKINRSLSNGKQQQDGQVSNEEAETETTTTTLTITNDYDINDNNKKKKEYTANNTVAILVHVGKTGGATLNKVLRCGCEWIQGTEKRYNCFAHLNQFYNIQTDKNNDYYYYHASTNSINQHLKQKFGTRSTTTTTTTRGKESERSTKRMITDRRGRKVFVSTRNAKSKYHGLKNNNVEIMDRSGESKISNITKVKFHGAIRNEDDFHYWNTNHTIENSDDDINIVYLVTIRNPIDRIVSAFNFHHPYNNNLETGTTNSDTSASNKSNGNNNTNNKIFIQQPGLRLFYGQCFPTIEDMANILDKHPPKGSNRWRLQQQRQQQKLREEKEPEEERGQQPKQIKRQEQDEEFCAQIGRHNLQSTTRSSTSSTSSSIHTSEKSTTTTTTASVGRSSSKPKVVYHMYTNYEYYGNFTYLLYPQREIWVIRTEHLWDDMNYLERDILHGLTYKEGQQRQIDDADNDEQPFFPSSSSSASKVTTNTNTTSSIQQQQQQQQQSQQERKNTHGSEFYSIQSKLSKRGKKIFCCEIYDEIQIYQNLIHSSTNLRIDDKRQTMEVLFHQCDIEFITTATNDKNKNNISNDRNEDSIISMTTFDNIQYTTANFSWLHWASTVC